MARDRAADQRLQPKPQVATFAAWTIPTLLPGDPGHYCVVAFAHSQLNPINETNTIVDAIATSNPQVAQKNLHVTTLMPIGRAGFGLREYVEFHNPTAEELVGDLVIELSELPEGPQALVQLTHLDTRVEIAGGQLRRDTGARHELSWLRHWSERFEEAAEREDHDRDDRLYIPRFAPNVYAVHPASAFQVRGVRLKPFATAAAIFAITTHERSMLTRDLRFRVVQRVNGRVFGGSTYWIRSASFR